MRFLLSTALFLACALAGNAQSGAKRSVSDAEVERVHRSAILIDTHNDVTSFTVEGSDIGKPDPERHTDLPRMKKGGMGAQFFAVYVAASYVEGNRSANRTLEMIDTVKHDIVERYPGDLQFATSVAGIRAARREGKIAALMGIEGGHAIEDSLRLLRRFYDLGIRYMTLTHSNSNNWADSSGDIEKPHDGLAPFGEEVVAEMNRLGMMVDISHVSDATFWDVMRVSKAPPFASHSSARALANIPRNMTDDMIQALGKRGGVIQINFGCEFLSQKSADASAAARPKMMAAMRELGTKYKNDPEGLKVARREMFRNMRRDFPSVPATIEDVVAQIDHVVKIAGVGAVGIGSDFDGVGCVPVGLSDVGMWPNLTRALLERGYSQEEIQKIYGENLLRVMGATEKVAAEAGAGR
ncbi:MAG: dipeptidase [Bryobacterales bacterium]|nr:dipeptidase [Bryobacterales bacterium]